MKTIKSNMYRKILGDFGELFILYWLSKRNHEPVLIDYTGIDILSLNKSTGKSWGISVKSRIRAENKEKSSINVPAKQILLIKEACKSFNCEGFFGCVIDKEKSREIDIYIIPFEKTLEINNYNQKRLYIKFNDNYINLYKELKNSIIIQMKYNEIIK